jgi:hypothetical protein
VLEVTPPEAATHTRVSLLFDADEAQAVVDGAAEWPVDVTLPAGPYRIQVETDAPWEPARPKLVYVRPLEYRDTVELAT